MSRHNELPDIVEGVFPSGQLHLISGSRGAGKTSWEIWMERAVLGGHSFLGRETWRPPFWGVLIFDRAAKDRLDCWEAIGMEPLPYYCLTDDVGITPEKLLTQNPRESLFMLEQAIDQLEPPPGGVITIDVANFFAGDANLSYRSGFAHGWAIAKMASQRQLTVFALMHGGKQRAGHQYLRLTDRTIASTGFMGTANAFAYIATREESVALIDPTQSDDLGGRKDAQVFEWEPRKGATERFILGRSPNGLLTCLSGPAAGTRKERDIDPVVQQRLNAIVNCFLALGEVELDQPMLQAELGLEISRSTLSRDMNLLVASGRLTEVKRGRKVYYRLAHYATES